MANADIELKRNDTRPWLDVVLKDVNGAVDLTGSSVKFTMTDSAGNEVTSQTTTGSQLTIEDSTAGSVRYKWLAADTSTGDELTAEFEVTFGDGSKATFPNTQNLSVLVLADLDST